MNWRWKTLLVLNIGGIFASVAWAIEACSPDSPIVVLLLAIGVFLILLAALHFCLNTIAESLSK